MHFKLLNGPCLLLCCLRGDHLGYKFAISCDLLTIVKLSKLPPSKQSQYYHDIDNYHMTLELNHMVLKHLITFDLNMTLLYCDVNRNNVNFIYIEVYLLPSQY